MGTGGDYGKAIGSAGLLQRGARASQVDARLGKRFADGRRRLHLRLQQLAADGATGQLPCARQEVFVRVRDQRLRLLANDEEFFLDAESKVHGAAPSPGRVVLQFAQRTAMPGVSKHAKSLRPLDESGWHSRYRPPSPEARESPPAASVLEHSGEIMGSGQ